MEGNDVKGFHFKACIKPWGRVLTEYPRDHRKSYLNSRMSFSQSWEHDTGVLYTDPERVGLLEFGLKLQMKDVF